MIKVLIPPNNIPERHYALHILLSKCLGLEFDLIPDESISNYILQFGQSALIIEDAFFNSFPKPLSYLVSEAIPIAPYQSDHPEFNKAIILYGMDRFDHVENTMRCHADLVAGAFFMLSRWEEYVIRERDEHDRFPASKALAVRHKFLNIPVVNSYAEILKKWLVRLGVSENAFRTRFYSKVITHDIDHPFYWKGPVSALRKLASSAHQTKTLKAPASVLNAYFKYLSGKCRDPYDVYDWIMDRVEENNVRAHFFFMSGGKTVHDPGSMIYDRRVKARIQRIKKRQHCIGFHPSYDTYNNAQLFQEEKNKLEQVIGGTISTGRQHYLRFSNPETWQIWENAKMEWDSTMGYAQHIGFRNGICYAFPIFNILTRKRLGLHEKPLLIMDVTLKNYMRLSAEVALKECLGIADQVKKHSGELVVLWHNSYFNSTDWVDFTNVFLRILKS